LEFVTFYVDVRSHEKVHPNQTLEHKDYLSHIDMMFRSARMFHPDIAATILTDSYTDLTGVSSPFKRVARQMDPRRLMLERAVAELQYVSESSLKAPIIFLDSDILMNGSIVELCREEFDVALTWRVDRNMPINGGFMILNPHRPEMAKRFFTGFVRIYQEHYAESSHWFGDQLALRDCIGLSYEEMAVKETVEIDGCRVRLLSCETYNFSPANQYGAICTSLAGKVVLHFKGERKRLMAPFWKAWLRPAYSRMPWDKLHGWIERRRLRRLSERERSAACPALQHTR
jgi:hypothetical protein